jgi:hypothetical protein
MSLLGSNSESVKPSSQLSRPQVSQRSRAREPFHVVKSIRLLPHWQTASAATGTSLLGSEQKAKLFSWLGSGPSMVTIDYEGDLFTVLALQHRRGAVLRLKAWRVPRALTRPAGHQSSRAGVS